MNKFLSSSYSTISRILCCELLSPWSTLHSRHLTPFCPGFLSTFLDILLQSPLRHFFSITQLLKFGMSQGLVLEPLLCLQPVFPQGHYWLFVLNTSSLSRISHAFQDVLHPWTLPPCLSPQYDNPNCLQAVSRKMMPLRVKNDFVLLDDPSQSYVY